MGRHESLRSRMGKIDGYKNIGNKLFIYYLYYRNIFIPQPIPTLQLYVLNFINMWVWFLKKYSDPFFMEDKESVWSDYTSV